MKEIFIQLLAVAIVLSSMLVTLGIMYILLKRRDATVQLPIDREKLQRLPALGLQQQIQDLQMDLLAAMLMGLMAVSLPFAFKSVTAYLTVGEFPWLFAFVAIIGLIATAVKITKTFGKLTKLRLGHTAEVATANELIALQAKGYQVFHDIQADGFNIDHLAVGTNGVFAIETKGRYKRHKDNKNNGKNYQMSFQDGRLAFPSWTESKPIEQAQRQAKWVSQWLTKATGNPVTATPVLVFPGWYITNKSRPPFPILNHKQLAKTLPTMTSNQQGGKLLSPQEVKAIVYQVAQRCLSTTTREQI
ncbi:NERD domain-containing protein [Shewanella maritima]|uniref:NERD domain-containing protein n=1 Tax=Shewanella maritima TaxID=2520507 RepID=A0A411PJL4_9GAMM|nr:nuclease-related domain-containing protein [Shewanella maritima]QBF83777.1 NERD domain-containing protein [Shewanella maritima]